MNHLLLTLSLLCTTSLLFGQNRSVNTLQVPGLAEYCKINPAGHSVLPSGRYVTPVGKTLRITRSPFGMTLSPDQKKALVLHHNGVLTVIDLQQPDQATRIPSYDKKIPAINNATFIGAAFAPDNKTAYLSGGDGGNIAVFNTETLRKTDSISLNGLFEGIDYTDSYTSDLALDATRGLIYALDRGNNRLVRVDIASRRITGSVNVGRIPFGITLVPDGKMAFVANVGLYNYPLVPGLTLANKDSMLLQFPPYAHPTPESEKGVTLPDGRFVPGLGSALAEEAMSVWTIDLDKMQVVDRFKTGHQIGEIIEEVEIVGGASPNSIAVGSRYAYVSNASNDLITVIDHRTHQVKSEIKLRLDKRVDAYRGLMPFGLCLSPDEKTLYVALLGLNAVAVVDVAKGKVKGYIPTGWGTTRVLTSKDGRKLFITSARGLGAGPNGGKGFVDPPQGTYIGDIQLGTFQIVDAPDAATLKTWTQQVIDNTFRTVAIMDDGKNPLPPARGLRQSPIKHIFYITKENRTYDEMLGQLPGGVRDETLARFGVGVNIAPEKGGIDTLRNARVSPNHLNIAKKWAFSDNFYCDSDASIHGHHWMIGHIPNEYVEANSAADGRFDPASKAPGRRFPKATGAVDPEDYNEIGGLWENLARNGIDFFNFGEANEYSGVQEEWNDTEFGASQSVVFPMPKSVYSQTSRTYAGYNTNIPDQFRMDQFEQEFTQRWLQGKDTMPALIALQLPNDHTSGPRPEDGYPYRHSYVADNDMALGRILHFLSRTPYWKSTLVIITEDDPQGGVDHVDAHRSVLLMAGPYVKRGYISHRHANFGSLLRVIYTVLDLPLVNQYDQTASLLDDFFTPVPDFTPFSAEEADVRVYDAKKSLQKYGKNFDWRKIQQGPRMDDEGEQRKDHYQQKH
jgi:DNA-binding beta-propeller fold protein YncE